MQQITCDEEPTLYVVYEKLMSRKIKATAAAHPLSRAEQYSRPQPGVPVLRVDVDASVIAENARPGRPDCRKDADGSAGRRRRASSDHRPPAESTAPRPESAPRAPSDGRAVNHRAPRCIIRSPINVGPKWDWKDNRFVHMDELDPPMRGVGRALTTRSRVNACQPGLFTEYLLLSILQ